MSEAGKRIIDGLDEALAWSRGETTACLFVEGKSYQMTRSEYEVFKVGLQAGKEQAAATITAQAQEIERLRGLVCDIAPYIDSIVCYASTVDEHLPNRIARDVNAEAARAAIRKETT